MHLNLKIIFFFLFTWKLMNFFFRMQLYCFMLQYTILVISPLKENAKKVNRFLLIFAILTLRPVGDIFNCTPAVPDEGAGGGRPCFKDIFNWCRRRAADDRRVSRARFMGGVVVLCFRIASANDCNSQSSFIRAIRSLAAGGNGGFEVVSLKDSFDTIAT